MHEVTREVFWNVGGGARWITYALMVVTFAILIYGIKKRYAMWRIGKPAPINFWEQATQRVVFFIKNGVFHASILRPREAFPGLMHLFIFWGFLILAIGTALVALEDDFFKPLFGFTYLHGNFYLIFSFLTDLGGLVAIVGILLAAIRRYVLKPARIESIGDDALALGWILAILVTGFLVEAARIAGTFPEPSFETVSFVGWALASIFPKATAPGYSPAHAVLWWVHVLISFGFIAYLVYSKRMLHVITSTMNMLFHAIEENPRGALAPIEDFENAEEFGVNQIDGFTWRQIFDLDACTRCGRCQDRCPGYLSQKPLSPRSLIQDLKTEWERIAMGGEKKEEGIIDTVINEETLWSCTACLSCQVNCPVSIPTFDKTLEMRRYLSMTLSQVSPEVKNLYKNLQKNQNPYGMGKKGRTEWTEGLEVKNAAAEEVEYLYWVGCVASLDDRNRKVARAVATILDKAGVSFGTLGADEICCGDPLRRTGNEYQYQENAQTNVEMFKELGIKKIITACPHCYNTLKNDYAQLGADYEVFHHTEIIEKLAREGKISIAGVLDGTTTYHDPCYLGRVNQIFDAPRSIVNGIKKGSFVELGRNRDEGFCCGGGGGKIWMEEHHEKVCHLRMDEAIEISANTVITACPYCLIMMEDAIKDKEKSETMKAMDISEAVAKGL
jgi:Fe-S oxidoreductase/nitrate reductase gamma subunit